MTSLRMRIAVLLVVAIVSVVGLATLTATSLLRRPPPEGRMRPVAHHIHLLARLASVNTRSLARAGLDLRARPASGRVDERGTHILNRELRLSGTRFTAIVTHDAEKPFRTASVRLPDGQWMIVRLPDFSPPTPPWLAMFGWIALIVLGASGISYYFAAILTKPLEMLETAVTRVGPDGVLAPLPEQGSEELRATAHALNRLSARLKGAMESRMRLVAAAGHDLRTPMTRMRLRAEFVTDEEEREKWLKDLDELDRIADSAIRLVREEVEDDEGRQPVALGSLLRGIADDLAGLDLSVTLGRLDEASVQAGALSLQRALRNLIVNAATHGKGCTVALTAGAGKAVVAISDNGPGIPPELLDKAFEPFFRVDPARRQSVPGAGLGLAIAKEIVERYGGHIALANRPEGGLIQTITFDTV